MVFQFKIIFLNFVLRFLRIYLSCPCELSLWSLVNFCFHRFSPQWPELSPCSLCNLPLCNRWEKHKEYFFFKKSLFKTMITRVQVQWLIKRSTTLFSSDSGRFFTHCAPDQASRRYSTYQRHVLELQNPSKRFKEVERPFYCLQSGFFLHQALKNWQSMPAVIFVAPQILKIFMMGWYAFGVFWLLTSTFAIDHFELFGLRQGLGMGKFLRFVPDGFVTIFHYRLVRHPIMTGFFIMLFSIVNLQLDEFSFLCLFLLTLWFVFLIILCKKTSVRDKISGRTESSRWNWRNIRKIYEDNTRVHPFPLSFL